MEMGLMCSWHTILFKIFQGVASQPSLLRASAANTSPRKLGTELMNVFLLVSQSNHFHIAL